MDSSGILGPYLGVPARTTVCLGLLWVTVSMDTLHIGAGSS